MLIKRQIIVTIMRILREKWQKIMILTHVAFGAPEPSEKFHLSVQWPIFLVEYRNTNRMVVGLNV